MNLIIGRNYYDVTRPHICGELLGITRDKGRIRCGNRNGSATQFIPVKRLRLLSRRGWRKGQVCPY